MQLLLVLVVALLGQGRQSAADIYVNAASEDTEDIMDSEPSDFGPMIPLQGMAGYLLLGVPEDGCSPLQLLPPSNDSDTYFFVILRRTDNCTFTQQVFTAQQAGFKAAIVHNVGSDDIDPMEGEDSVRIPSVFIGESNGIMLKANFLFGSGYYLILTGNYPFTFFAFLVPAILACVGCLILLCCMQLCRCISDRRRLRRRLLPTKVLQAIPTSTFKSGEHQWETCAICLEDYVDNDVLRVLPCRHAFHCHCVDPWLTRNKRVCPVCKRRVLSATQSMSCWESDDERPLPESERRPLLRTRATPGYGATLPAGVSRHAGRQTNRAAQATSDTSSRRPLRAEVEVYNGVEALPQPVVVTSQRRRRRRRRRDDGYRRLSEQSTQPPYDAEAAAGATSGLASGEAAAPAAAAGSGIAITSAAPAAARAALPAAASAAAPAEAPAAAPAAAEAAAPADAEVAVGPGAFVV